MTVPKILFVILGWIAAGVLLWSPNQTPDVDIFDLIGAYIFVAGVACFIQYRRRKEHREAKYSFTLLDFETPVRHYGEWDGKTYFGMDGSKPTSPELEHPETLLDFVTTLNALELQSRATFRVFPIFEENEETEKEDLVAYYIAFRSNYWNYFPTFRWLAALMVAALLISVNLADPQFLMWQTKALFGTVCLLLFLYTLWRRIQYIADSRYAREVSVTFEVGTNRMDVHRWVSRFSTGYQPIYIEEKGQLAKLLERLATMTEQTGQDIEFRTEAPFANYHLPKRIRRETS